MIHYENMTKEQVISILKDTEEYIGEVHKDYDVQKEEIEKLREENDIAEEKVKSAIKEIERLTAESTKYESKFYDEVKENERLNNKNEELLTLYTSERNVKEDYKSIIKEVREYTKFLKEHYEELRTSPIEDSYFINDMLRQMFIQSIENYLLGIEDILDKENKE